ncbi:MAG: AAA family ATPase [Mesotoga sp.]|nr:AAA family ATPase [Mesotoga sp.]
MKILDLRLLAFGPFTDVNLFFPDDVGMHIIFGPNEAGKSSALRALISLLYGIEHNTPDNFIHDYQKLKIGGRLRNSDGQEIAFLRRKGRKDTLLSPKGNPIGEDALQPFLYGVGRELFQTIFGISHAELLEGGKDILQGKGEIGQSLFAAGLGSANLRGLLTELESEAGTLFLARGKRAIINAVDKYKEKRYYISKISLSSREWSEHVRSLKTAETELDAVIKEMHRLESERNRLQRLQAVIPNIGRRKELLIKLKEFQEVPILSRSFTEDRQRCVKELETKKEIIANAKPALEIDKQKLEGIVIPDLLIDHEGTILELYERRGAYLKALRDLPGLEDDKNQLETEAKSLLSDVRPDLTFDRADEAELSAVERSKIQELGNQYQAMVERSEKAEENAEHLKKELTLFQEKLDSLQAQRNPVELCRLVDRIKRQGELERLLAQASKELKKAEDQAKIDLERLGLWSGALEELESLSIPLEETIDRFEFEFHELGNKLKNLAIRIGEFEDSIRELDRQLEELRLSGAVPTEEELSSVREVRNYGWSLIKREWLDKEDITEEKMAFDPENDLPAAYEKSVANADQVGDRLHREADRVASQAKTISEKSKKANILEMLQKEKGELQDQLSKVGKEWQSVWATSGIVPLTPKEMRSWVGKQNDLVRQSEDVRQKRQEIESLRKTIERHRLELGEALERLGEPQPEPKETLEMLLDRCDNVNDSIEKLSMQRKELKNQIQEINKKVDKSDQEWKLASGRLMEWEAQWAAAMESIGLTGKALPSEAYVIMDKIGKLSQKLSEAKNLKKRIDGINKDAGKLMKDISALTEHIAPDLKKLSGDQAVVVLHSRLRKAQEDTAVAKELKDQIKKRAKEIDEAEGVRRLMKERLAAMCEQAKCSEYSELEAIEELSANYQERKEKLEMIEEQLLEQGAGATIEEIVQEAESIDIFSLPGEIEDIVEKMNELEAEHKRLQETVWEERKYLMEKDGNEHAALAAEEAEGILAEIRDYVRQYIRLLMASSILRREIERYRSENQGPLLSIASGLFTQLTRSSFSGLRSDYNEKDEPVLVGVRPSGEIIGVECMSDGTRDQLYLSLRLASLERYLEKNEPIPFVVDDILIKFDDERAEATLNVLAQLSTKTQVIFFTHHNHLVELAEKVGGEKVRIHRLSG